MSERKCALLAYHRAGCGLRCKVPAIAPDRTIFKEMAFRRELIAKLTDAATKASAELRHAYRTKTIDRGLVARSIEILERAVTKANKRLENFK